MKKRLPLLLTSICLAILTAGTYLLAKKGGLEISVSLVVTVTASAVLGMQIQNLVRDNRRRERQIRELDLRAHELQVSARDLDHTVDQRHDASELSHVVARKLGRHEKIGILVDEVGFEITMKIVKQAARTKAPPKQDRA